MDRFPFLFFLSFLSFFLFSFFSFFAFFSFLLFLDFLLFLRSDDELLDEEDDEEEVTLPSAMARAPEEDDAAPPVGTAVLALNLFVKPKLVTFLTPSSKVLTRKTSPNTTSGFLSFAAQFPSNLAVS